MLRRRAYSFGGGQLGALGTGSLSPAMEAMPIELPCPPSKVSSGWGMSGALLQDGTLHVWGSYIRQRVALYAGFASKSFPTVVSALSAARITANSLTPEQVVLKRGELLKPADASFVDVDVCAALCLGVTSGGEVVAGGDNAHGQCGVGTSDRVVWPPRRVRNLGGKRVTQVSAGLHHALAPCRVMVKQESAGACLDIVH